MPTLEASGTQTCTINTEHTLATFSDNHNICLKLDLNALTNNSGGVTEVAVNAGGSSYVVGDVLTITGGGGTGCQVVVTAVSGGVVTEVGLLGNGYGYSTTSGAATSGGTGSGCTIDIDAVGYVSDLLFVRVYNKVLSGGTSRLMDEAVFSGPQGNPIKISPPFASDIETVVKIECWNNSSSRSVPWALLSL